VTLPSLITGSDTCGCSDITFLTAASKGVDAFSAVGTIDITDRTGTPTAFSAR